MGNIFKKRLVDVARHKKTANVKGEKAKEICDQCKNLEGKSKELAKAARDFKNYVKNKEEAVQMALESGSNRGNTADEIIDKLQECYDKLGESFKPFKESYEAIGAILGVTES